MQMEHYVLEFSEIDPAQVALVGGKGAHLVTISRIEGIRVPSGFCVTTLAFDRVIAKVPSLDDRLDQLSRLRPDDREAIQVLCGEIRAGIESIDIPADVAEAIADGMAGLGGNAPVAVRSSATAEDLPTASFAGQQDTFLNVVGPNAILEHVRRCWASLFTERAVSYRLRNGFDHRKVRMAVVVQRMVFPDASGVLFTADPISGNRNVASIEACLGLGEALVSGLINPDVYKVREGEVISRAIAAKRNAVRPSLAGGTLEEPIAPGRRHEPALTDEQAVRIAGLGRRIETHFDRPQDIEWCLVENDVHIVQSRPITTLFPIPAADDEQKHVYLSVGHQQMMTDPMKPLGLSFWQMTTPRPMAIAAGRLFVDVTGILASPDSREGFLEGFGRTDPLTRDALQTVLDRGDIIPSLPADDHGRAPDGQSPDRTPAQPTSGSPRSSRPPWLPPTDPIEADPAIVAELIANSEASIATLKRDIRTKGGPALLDFILDDIQELKRVLFHPRSTEVIMAAMEATRWLNERLSAWLDEKGAADMLAQSVPGNVTSEMGLALLAVADVIRPHSEVVAFLERVEDDEFLDRLPALAGGRGVRAAIEAWLARYGMRGAGEIDITRPRWSERPSLLIPTLLGNVRNFEPGAGEHRFEQGLAEARKKEQEILERLRALPDGERKANETRPMIDRVRAFAGYREYPKYGMISRYFVYKQALLGEAGHLVRAGVLREEEDIFYLAFAELQDVVRTNGVNDALIRERRAAFESYRALKSPRVLTSEGEVVNGAYRRDDLPAGALVGLAVSAGTVEGRARVILDLADAEIEPGDILVTAFTDPSWTPLFVAVAGLVTEVGGLMTHGAVIAREYGLPAVVGVEDATRLISDGQRIRLHGAEGYVELLQPGAE